MDISIAELYKGKSTLIKNKEFFPTKTYVEPFIERMSAFTDDFRLQIKMPDQMTFSKDATDLTYNRVLVQAVLPRTHTIEKHDEVIGFLYGLDVKKPIVKIYRGYLNQACTNLTVFNPQWLEVQELVPGDPINYGSIQSLLERPNDFGIMLEKLKNTIISRELRTQYLGGWVDYALRESQDYGFGKVKIAVSTPVDAYKQLFINSDSDYFIPEGIDPTLYDIYNSFTQIVTDDKKDIMNKFEKTMIINNLLKIK
ncbi:MAG: hypothetical protein ACOH2V_00960 [Candidatus Saccharimonadaceae bacterium]